MKFIDDSLTGAYFGDSTNYRYTLWRRWSECRVSEMMAVIGLNPSTADSVNNDPTIRRCIDFAKRWQFQGLIMLNLFSWRATDPAVMIKQIDPIGRENDDAIKEICSHAGRVMLAWGNDGVHMGRAEKVLSMIKPLCNPVFLKRNASGQPAHPLYVHSSTQPILWPF